ncbi:hypothetical protein chiPu_0024891 [Chiloscyllium punctatum]|uniref:Uncharacterized protein n=1 Tax=Chiloscyllium punctatum TaxID=137246 RepID=A0A401TDM3_CHIPU|nr:hypothetical protein [Chiloscyllium punctatum]
MMIQRKMRVRLILKKECHSAETSGTSQRFQYHIILSQEWGSCRLLLDSNPIPVQTRTAPPDPVQVLD